MIISFRSAPVFGGILSVLSRRCRPSVLFTRLTDALEPTDGSDEVDRYALLPAQRDDLTDQIHYIVALFIGFGRSHRRAVGLVATLAADTASRPWDDTRITDATGQPHDSLTTRLRATATASFKALLAIAFQAGARAYGNNRGSYCQRFRVTAVMAATSGWTGLIKILNSSGTITDGTSSKAVVPAAAQLSPAWRAVSPAGMASQPPGRGSSCARASHSASGMSMRTR